MSKNFSTLASEDTGKETEEQIGNNYILREYFKGFKLNKANIANYKEIINKLHRPLLLDNIVKQNEEVYDLVSENYSSSIDMVIYLFYIV